MPGQVGVFIAAHECSVLLRDSVVSVRLLRESSDLAVTLRLSVQPCFALISMNARAAALSLSVRYELSECGNMLARKIF